MKKKYLILLIGILILTGCFKKEIKKEVESPKKEEIVESTPTYQDNNNAPISFYKLKGNKLEKVSSLTGNFYSMDDVTLLQIYPSNEETITLNDTFSNSFYNTWNNYNINNNLKIGFSLEIPLKDNTIIRYNILGPNQTMNYWEYFMAYLYDDYANRNKSFYSHIESNDYNENTLFTALKLQCGGLCDNISSPVKLTVYTYDSEDDFKEETYRGNSQYSIPICMHNDC